MSVVPTAEPYLWLEQAGSVPEDLDALRRACLGPDWHLSELLGPASVLVLAQAADGRTAGFALGRVLLDELHIDELGVAAAQRGAGLGGRILRALHAQALACGARFAFLEVREGNEAGKALYRGQGYRCIQRRIGYYRDGENALTLLAFLDGAAAFPEGDERGAGLRRREF